MTYGFHAAESRQDANRRPGSFPRAVRPITGSTDRMARPGRALAESAIHSAGSVTCETAGHWRAQARRPLESAWIGCTTTDPTVCPCRVPDANAAFPAGLRCGCGGVTKPPERLHCMPRSPVPGSSGIRLGSGTDLLPVALTESVHDADRQWYPEISWMVRDCGAECRTTRDRQVDAPRWRDE